MRLFYPSKPHEIISIYYLYRYRREREREKGIRNTQTFTFQTCRRNPIYCIPSPKTSRLSSIRLEISFGYIKHSQQVWIIGRWSTLVSLIHSAFNKSKSSARELLDNKWNCKVHYPLLDSIKTFWKYFD